MKDTTWIKFHDRSRRRSRYWFAYWLVVVNLVGSGVYAQKIDSTQATPSRAIAVIPQVIQQVDLLTRTYLDPEMRVRENRFVVKLNEGRLHYFKEDYRTAAMTLLELVETYNQRKTLPIYKDALFYLADSLYHIGNYRTSARFFEEVLTLREDRMRPCALGRLLEISMEIEEAASPKVFYQDALKVANEYEEGHLFYLLGKYSYRLGKFQRAINLWERIKKESSMYPQSLYFKGVAFIELGKLDEALSIFRQVKSLDLELLKLAIEAEATGGIAPEVDVVTGTVVESGSTRGREQSSVTGCTFRSAQEREAEIRGWELVRAHAELAIGRVLYEMGKLDESLSAYLAIDRSSRLFRDAIKESVWVSIKKGEYQSALQQMDVQLIDEPNMLNDPYTRLLQGRLLSILGRFSDAKSVFSELKTRFISFKSTSLTPLERSAQGQLSQYFQRRLSKGDSALNLESILPKAATQFAGPELSSDSSRSLFVELGALERDITYSKDTIKDLYWVLGAPKEKSLRSEKTRLSPGQSEIFPRLHKGLLTALELRYQLFAGQVAINEQQGAQLATTAGYQELRQARSNIGLVVSEFPQTEVQLNEREGKIGHQLMLTDLELFRLSVSLKHKRAQLMGLKTYLENADPDEIVGALGPRERASALDNVRRELSEHEKQLAKLDALSREIKRTHLHVGLFDAVFLKEESIRSAYAEAINRESEWLSTQGRFPVDRLTELSRAHTVIDDFQRRSLKLIIENSDMLRDQVKAEEEKIKAYEVKLKRLSRQARKLAGRMVARTFYKVLKRLNGLILEADAGILDMLWAQKSQSSEVVQDERDRRRVHFEVLNRDTTE